MPAPNEYAARSRASLPGATRVRLALLALVAVAAMTAMASPALAQSPPDSPGSRPSAGGGPTDEREVEAFLDGFFAQQLEGHKIPGATFSVVRDGEILFAKGYGQADVAKGEPVVADEETGEVQTEGGDEVETQEGAGVEAEEGTAGTTEGAAGTEETTGTEGATTEGEAAADE